MMATILRNIIIEKSNQIRVCKFVRQIWLPVSKLDLHAKFCPTRFFIAKIYPINERGIFLPDMLQIIRKK